MEIKYNKNCRIQLSSSFIDWSHVALQEVTRAAWYKLCVLLIILLHIQQWDGFMAPQVSWNLMFFIHLNRVHWLLQGNKRKHSSSFPSIKPRLEPTAETHHSSFSVSFLNCIFYHMKQKSCEHLYFHGHRCWDHNKLEKVWIKRKGKETRGSSEPSGFNVFSRM